MGIQTPEAVGIVTPGRVGWSVLPYYNVTLGHRDKIYPLEGCKL